MNRAVAVVLAWVVLATAAAAGAGEPEAGPVRGIKVHGEWTIEVRNPDGSLASRREFKNALVAGSGDAVLARMLGRVQPLFVWMVEVGETTDDGSGGPCAPPTTPPNGVACFVKEPELTVTRAGATVRLSGSVTAVKGAPQLSRFSTLIDTGTVPVRFTEKRLAAPVPVTAGQIVQITVVFSFS